MSRAWALVGLSAALAGCTVKPRRPPAAARTPDASLGTSGGPSTPDAGVPAPPIFQPGFHQALRWTEYAAGWTTYRLRVPIGRAGDRLRVTFRSGDGALAIQAANVALAGGDGALASAPAPLSFGGQPGFRSEGHALTASDPVAFPVQLRQDLYVSFEAQGALAASAIGLFPESYAIDGSFSAQAAPFGGVPHPQAIGVATIDVEGPPGRAAVVLGDSITEGYVDGQDDYRNAWPAVAEQALGFPVVDAAVSGQDVYGALQNLDQEVLALKGITDCVVLLGTNDLGIPDPGEIEGVLTQIYARLHPFCRVFGATLPPKERTTVGDYSQVVADRVAVNAWLRTLPAPLDGLIDFESVLRSSTDLNLYAPGLGMDGIHPTVRGQAAMGALAAQVLATP